MCRGTPPPVYIESAPPPPRISSWEHVWSSVGKKWKCNSTIWTTNTTIYVYISLDTSIHIIHIWAIYSSTGVHFHIQIVIFALPIFFSPGNLPSAGERGGGGLWEWQIFHIFIIDMHIFRNNSYNYTFGYLQTTFILPFLPFQINGYLMSFIFFTKWPFWLFELSFVFIWFSD